MSGLNEKTEWKKLFSEDNRLLYEGFTYKDKPCGTGVAYFSNGAKYQEGQFGIKGLLSGKEYYPNGSLRFEGEFRLNRAYGPNPPVSGSFYDSEGKLLYQGEFKLHRGGVGYPAVEVPEEYGPIRQKDHPEDLKYPMWDDVMTEEVSS